MVRPTVDNAGVTAVPSFSLPWSAFASQEGKSWFIDYNQTPLPMNRTPSADIGQQRENSNATLEPFLEKQKARYAVNFEPKTIAGVYTEIFTPKDGIAPKNQNRILINLHGGGFRFGARKQSGIESIPIAAIGRIKVVSIDYRLAPENHFPAASQDVEAVYRELLKQHKPQDIGIYGCSAGGILTAQSVAWFDKVGLPRPGAIGVFCASLMPFMGDSAFLSPREGSLFSGRAGDGWNGMDYFSTTTFDNPLVAPAASPALLKKFPPTLFVTGTRAPEMSAAVHSQILLLRAGVDARISIWDAMDHGFMSNPDLPEAREEYEIVADFFDRELGRR